MLTLNIDEGSHYSSWGLHRLRLLFGKKLIRYRFRLHLNCLYDPKLLGKNAKDINKLFGAANGFSIGKLKGKKVKIGRFEFSRYGFKESRRTGWTCDWEKKLFLFWTYDYEAGGRKHERLINTAKPMEWVTGELIVPGWLGVLLWFFFGGDRSAPHFMSMDFEIMEIK